MSWMNFSIKSLGNKTNSKAWLIEMKRAMNKKWYGSYDEWDYDNIEIESRFKNEWILL